MILINNKTRYSTKFLRSVLSGALKQWQKKVKSYNKMLINKEVQK